MNTHSGSGLPQEKILELFTPFSSQIKGLLGDKIISIFIYGSAAAGTDFVSQVSDINSVFVMHSIDFDDLKIVRPTIEKYFKNRIAPPLFFTREGIYNSRDVFPIEFLEMKENHILVFGEDILSSLDIPGEYVRVFCEQQIKGKLIKLRQTYFTSRDNAQILMGLMQESLNSLLPVFRNMLRLKGELRKTDKNGTIEDLCRSFDLESGVFKSVHGHKTGHLTIAPGNALKYFGLFIEDLNSLADKVDSFKLNSQ